MADRLEVHGWHLGRANLGALGCIRVPSLHYSKFIVSCWPGLGAVFQGWAVCSGELACSHSALFSGDRQHARARRTCVGRAYARASVHLHISQEQHGRACPSLGLSSFPLAASLQRSLKQVHMWQHFFHTRTIGYVIEN